ncbi:MAG: glycogen debranching protein [Verrucomicrobia bacterium]|nr:MAG: glycogen debranching protein [Verrucomicrobiota bacterium]
MTLTRRIDLRAAKGEDARQLLRREWLVTNGLGGYASGTISGNVAWRYHGLLIAALSAPFGRTVMLNHLGEFIRFPDGRRLQIGGEEPSRPDETGSLSHSIAEFRLENALPIWRYEVAGIILEKYVLFLQGQNTVHIHYRLLSSQAEVRLELGPSVHFRGHEHPVDEGSLDNYQFRASGEHYEITQGGDLPNLRLVLRGQEPAFTYDGASQREIYYQKDAERGYPSRGTLWSPGYFSVRLRPNRDATLIASTEWWHTMLALSPQEALGFYHDRHRRLIACADPALHSAPAAELVLAADQFIINPVGRVQDAARAHAAGDEVRTIIAGYHWFTDWGRDTMISLEGLTLATNRHTEAGWILRTFAHYIRDGLIPNLFPEGRSEGLYHTADATLWFFHALDRYVERTGDRATLRLILPRLADIISHHLRGTRFGIGVDPADGLLREGAPGYQLTWMDAKVGDWVVTPRRGKPVEINALWYNALRLFEGWLREERGSPGRSNLENSKPEGAISLPNPDDIAAHAQRACESFNRRFWYAQGSHLYDVVDGEEGDDAACRPNQLLALSLKHPVLDQQYWQPVLEAVRERLLTPLGLRSLSRDHPDYKPKYFGDLRARDAAYHQGTVWAWLIGPFIDAWLRVHPDDHAGARKFLDGFASHVDEACVGSISEVFDAEPPFTPRGCISQAWSVAEVLRAWVKVSEAVKES